MPQLLIMVPVLEAEPYVAQLRERFDPSARRGLGAHITIVHSNLSSDSFELKFLEHIGACATSTSPFEYRLTKVARFPGTLYLAAEPASRFALLKERLVPTLPATERGRQSTEPLVPHVSIVRKSTFDDQEVEMELTRMLSRVGPIACLCREFVLLENSSGAWRQVERFTLRGDTDSPWRASS